MGEDFPIAHKGIVDICPVAIFITISQTVMKDRIGNFHTGAFEQTSAGENVTEEQHMSLG